MSTNIPKVCCGNCTGTYCNTCEYLSKFKYSPEVINNFVKDNYLNMSDKEMSKVLGRAEVTIANRRRALGLSRGGGRKTTKFKGCNDDCFNCPYPDCMKSYKECTALGLEDPAKEE